MCYSSLIIVNQPQFYQTKSNLVVGDPNCGKKTYVAFALLTNDANDENLKVEQFIISAEFAHKLLNGDANVNTEFVFPTLAVLILMLQLQCKRIPIEMRREALLGNQLLYVSKIGKTKIIDNLKSFFRKFCQTTLKIV
jgi:hypothetical protein